MRVLITGASGFVGSHLTRLCVAEGCETIALVRERADLARISDVQAIQLRRADLADPESMRRVARDVRPDLAFHLAWRIAPDVHDAPENVECIGGSLALLRGLDEVGARAVFVGTHLEHAASEAPIAETSEVAPRNFYAVTKNALHEVARAFACARSMPFSWARLFNVYGPGEPPWPLVPTVIRTLLDGQPCELSEGDQARGYVHVEDVARALFGIGTASELGAFNVGSSEAVTVRELATRIADQIGRPDLLRFGARPLTPRDAPRIVADTSRLERVTGFRPRRGLDEGLASAIRYWRSQRNEVPARGTSSESTTR